jgi:penicillin-binding protein 2
MSSPTVERYEGLDKRLRLFAAALAFGMLVLCFQLWQIQVVSQSYYQDLARENSMGEAVLKSSRGVIYGRGGQLLADNRACTTIAFVPGECPEDRLKEVAELLEKLIGVPAAEVLVKVENKAGNPFEQIDIKRDVTKRDRVAVEEHGFALPGVVAVAQPQRRYLYGQVGGQLLGYLSEVNKEELKAWKGQGYAPADLVGRSGIERVYEETLHGTKGKAIITTYASGQAELRTDYRGFSYVAGRDSQGHVLGEEHGRTHPIPGNPVYLTLDIGLQAKCESLLAGHVGAAVVLNAGTGAVLALASTPGYDPSVFVTRGHNDERDELLTEEKPKRMRGRAYQDVYPPGSIFKIIMASAALQEKVIGPEETIFCPGKFKINPKGRTFHCHRSRGHGQVNIKEALAYSCDVFFYTVGLRLGIDKISRYSRAAGLGEVTGIDLRGEAAGLVPNETWKKAAFPDLPIYDQRWFPGETVSLSIGQGSLSTTPLQNAVMMAMAINGGRRVRPYLNEDFQSVTGEAIFSGQVLARVLGGIQYCVEKREGSPPGTGRHAYHPDFTIVGKTGTAQVVSKDVTDKFEEEEDIPYKFRDHAWFVAGVLDREPRIAVSVLVEHGLHGGSVCAPIARDVIEYFYTKNPAEEAETKLAAELGEG